MVDRHDTAADTVIFDIGKTNLKLTRVDALGQSMGEVHCPNRVVHRGGYPHFDTEAAWQWLLAGLRAMREPDRIDALITTTHGATVALVDDDALVTPILDYEFEGVRELDAHYDQLRDDFSLTLSPPLPGGLNVGRQLHWLSKRHESAFRRASHVLMYPQYWSWRLSGVKASEWTSLGCHTDLWLPAAQDFSPMVDRLGWRRLFAPLQHAGASLGALRPDVAQQTGLSSRCRVLCGVHDSNASMVKHLWGMAKAKPLTVISSGTWTVVAAFGVPLSVLDPHRDMLANVDAWGRPFACARFMGGREFAALTPQSDPGTHCQVDDLAQLVANNVFALPSFASMGGPYRGRIGRIVGEPPTSPDGQYALATLYCTLVCDELIGRLGSYAGDIVIEGAFTANPMLGGLLAQLRPNQPVWVSQDRSGTTGGAQLLALPAKTPSVSRERALPFERFDLVGYRDRWRQMISGW